MDYCPYVCKNPKVSDESEKDERKNSEIHIFIEKTHDKNAFYIHHPYISKKWITFY
jgi:hypothetical protein